MRAASKAQQTLGSKTLLLFVHWTQALREHHLSLGLQLFLKLKMKLARHVTLLKRQTMQLYSCPFPLDKDAMQVELNFELEHLFSLLQWQTPPIQLTK